MPVPAVGQSDLSPDRVKNRVNYRKLARLVRRQRALLRGRSSKHPSWRTTALRAATFTGHPVKLLMPGRGLSDSEAMALDWYMVGRDINNAINVYRKSHVVER